MPKEITDGQPVPIADAMDQKARILSSEALRQSEVLKAIFSFVTSEAISGNISTVKEYTIATEVLHQPAEFDGRTNNLVRVHANRLRQRLQVYYASEGGDDAVVIRLPKGSYVPRFSRRSGLPESRGAAGAHGSPPARPDQLKAPWGRNPWILAAGLVLTGFVAGAVSGFVYLSKSSTRPLSAANPGSNVYRLWKPFLAKDTPPVIVLAQRRFLLAAKDGVYISFRGPQAALTGTWINSLDTVSEFVDLKLLKAAGRLQFNDAITGLGEAEAAVLLSRVFLDLGAPAAVRKSGLLRVEDLRTNNVVFLGSPAVNPLLSPVLENGEYRFNAGGGVSHLANGAPREKFEIERDPKTGAVVRDVGLISVLPGLADGRKAAVLSGTWTFGTSAAARFCTDENYLGELLETPGFAVKGEFPEYFQAVVSGELVQGEIGRVRILAARAIKRAPPAASGSIQPAK